MIPGRMSKQDGMESEVVSIQCRDALLEGTLVVLGTLRGIVHHRRILPEAVLATWLKSELSSAARTFEFIRFPSLGARNRLDRTTRKCIRKEPRP
jgi:hypothetical protein